MQAFVTGLLPAGTLQSTFTGVAISTKAQSRNVRRRSLREPLVLTPRCQQQRTSEKGARTRSKGEKQKTLNFATDLKGRHLWGLRGVREDDYDKVIEMLGEGFPRDLLESLVNNTKGNLVVEASLKPSPGEDRYRSLITGFTLVDVTKRAFDKELAMETGGAKGLEKIGEFINIQVDPRMGDLVDSVKRKAVLGAMKMMKEEGVVTLGAHVVKENLPFWTSLGFVTKSKELDEEELDEQTMEMLSGLERVEADLLTLSPEPQIRIG